MVLFSARGKEFDIPKYLLRKHPNSLMYLLSNNVNIPIFKINNAIYLNIDPLHQKSICDMYNTGKHFCKNTDAFLVHDLKYLGFDVNYRIIPTLSHPIIAPKERKNDIAECEENREENGEDGKFVQTEGRLSIKYSRVHCFDGEIVVVDLSDGNLAGTHIGNIIYGNACESLISENGDYIDVSICMDSMLFNNILSVLRDGYELYHEYITKGIGKCIGDTNVTEDIDEDEEDEGDEEDEEGITNCVRLCEYLISYNVISRYGFQQLCARIENYNDIINSSHVYYFLNTRCADIYNDIICGCDISKKLYVRDFIAHKQKWIPESTLAKYRKSNMNIDDYKMMENDKEIVLESIMNYFYGYKPQE